MPIVKLMRVLQLLLVLAVSCAVYARKCKHPQPMENFSVDKFAGSWVLTAYDAQDPKDLATYSNAACAVKHYYVSNEDQKPNIWEFNMTISKGKISIDGTFNVVNSKKGFFKSFFTQGNFTYDETVLCTDYTTYCATYLCAEVSPDYTSEFTFLFVRDVAKYDQVIHDPILNDCFKEVLTIPLTEFTKPSIDNCSDL